MWAPHIDFSESEKVIMPGVTLHLRLHRSSSDFALNVCRHKWRQACARDWTGVIVCDETDCVRLSIEKALPNAPAHYPYIEMMNKSFIMQACQNSFVNENCFGTEPIRRLTLCMTTNEKFRGNRCMDAFHYQPYGLERLEITCGNGVPVPSAPLDMRNGRKILL